jgi:hypothetical protein
VPAVCGEVIHRGVLGETRRYYDITPTLEDEHRLISDWLLVGPFGHADDALPRAEDLEATKAHRCPRCGGKSLRNARARYGERYLGTDPRAPELKTRKRDRELVKPGESDDFPPGSTRGTKGVEGFLPEYREPRLSLHGEFSRLAFDHWDGYAAPHDWPNRCALCNGSGVDGGPDWPWQTGPRLGSHPGYDIDDEDEELLEATLVETESEFEHDERRPDDEAYDDNPELAGLDVAAETEDAGTVIFWPRARITSDDNTRTGSPHSRDAGTAGVRRLAAPSMPRTTSEARYEYVHALLFEGPMTGNDRWRICDDCGRQTYATAREAWACDGHWICDDCMVRSQHRAYLTAEARLALEEAKRERERERSWDVEDAILAGASVEEACARWGVTPRHLPGAREARYYRQFVQELLVFLLAEEGYAPPEIRRFLNFEANLDVTVNTVRATLGRGHLTKKLIEAESVRGALAFMIDESIALGALTPEHPFYLGMSRDRLIAECVALLRNPGGTRWAGGSKKVAQPPVLVVGGREEEDG